MLTRYVSEGYVRGEISMSHPAPGWEGPSASTCSSEADVAQLQGGMRRAGSYSSTSAGIGGDLTVIFQKKRLHGTRNLNIGWNGFCIRWHLLICTEARSMMRVLYRSFPWRTSSLQSFRFPLCRAAAKQAVMQHFSGGGTQNVDVDWKVLIPHCWHPLTASPLISKGF